MARVTSKDVAREAGVSQTTVSLVLNGRRDRGISEHTHRHVLATAAQMGYVPSAAARSLRSGKSQVVLGLVPDFTISQATEQFKVDLSRTLGEAGYSCVLLHHANTRPPLDRLWQNISPAAVVSFGPLGGEDSLEVSRAGVPLVDDVFGSESQHLTGIDQTAIGDLQVRHLAERGHWRIGFAAVTDPREARFCAPRVEGARAACAELGLPAPVVAVLDDPTPHAALQAWRNGGVTAVAAFNDLVGLSVVRAAHAQGMAVPEELAVIGVDNLQMADLVSPRLTSVAIDLAGAAHTLALHVLELVGADHRLKTAPPPGPVFRVVQRESA